MEIIKRKILIEDFVDRNYESPTYGSLTATSFYINVMITQNIDDMGLFTDIEYISDFSIEYSANTMDGIRHVGAKLSDYFISGDYIIGETESRIEDVTSYDKNEQYKVNFDINTNFYINYSGGSVNGVDRVTAIGDPITYVFDTDKSDPKIGLSGQTFGFLFNDFINNDIPLTTIGYKSEGWNKTNTSLSALTKEEYLFGIISKPEVNSDIFIDRGIASVLEKHLKLSEITNLDGLVRYGQNYYNITKN